MEVGSVLLQHLVLLPLVLLLVTVPQLHSHNHHRGFAKPNSKSDNKTEEYNQVQKVDYENVKNQFMEDFFPNDPEHTPVPTQQAVNAEVLMLLRSMTSEIDALRNAVSNLKLQNHLVYKTLRRMQSKCTAPTMPVIHSAAQKLEPVVAKPTCPRDFFWNKDLQSCYKFGTDRITWRMAREKCRAQGADLVSINSASEQQFIMEKARKSPDSRHCDFWTGLTDKEREGDWRWISDNRAVTYTNWNLNEPNNGNSDEHCMHMLWVFNWAWNDSHCNRDNGCYICEIHYEE